MQRIDPIEFIAKRLEGRRLTPAARRVAYVVAKRVILRGVEWRTYGLRKREIAELAGLHKESVQAATRALCTGADPIFEFRQVMEQDDRFGGLVRAWSYVLLAGDSHVPLHSGPNHVENSGETPVSESPAPPTAHP
jgi:hypothetical protein